VVLLADGDPPIGYAAVVWSYSIESGGPDALLDEIYVRRRGMGVGRRLMEEVFREVRARGMRRVFLETGAGNALARSFYSDLGFEVEDSVWMVADIG
jgi:GNAT superfamily N-acetyltransferase